MSPVKNPHTLDQRTSFGVSAAVVAHTLWTSAAPALTYPLYAAQWQLTPTATTEVFAIYPAVVVAVLLLFGNVSDYWGRRYAMLLGLAASLLGALLFALAPSVSWIFAGRIFMGIGVGLSAGPATAAMVEFNPSGAAAYASTMNAAAQALGWGAATLIGGALIQYAPFPTRLSFWLLSAVIAAILVIAWFLPRHIRTASPQRWHPGSIGVPREIAWVFVTSALVVASAYALGAVMLSLGAQIAKELIGSTNAFINGATISLFAVSSGLTTIAAGSFTFRAKIAFGTIASVVGLFSLVLAASTHSLAFFLLSSASTGFAYSLQFRGGLALVVDHAPGERRAGILSAIYLVAYLMMGLIALSLGVLATAWGLKAAVEIGCLTIATMSVAGFLLAYSIKRGPPQCERDIPAKHPETTATK
jgi:MFS family permease